MTRYEIDILYDGDPAGVRPYVFNEGREEILDSGVIGLDVEASSELYKAWVEYHNPERTTSRFYIVTELNAKQGLMELRLFDKQNAGPGPTDQCDIGKDLDNDLLSDAYDQFQKNLPPDHLDRH